MTVEQAHPGSSAAVVPPEVDAVVIGGGFGGIRTLLELKKLGLRAALLEKGSEIGGAWHWNRYPDARCDSTAWVYGFRLPDELVGDWDWDERYPTAETNRRYLDHLVDRGGLRDQIHLDATVTSAEWDSTRARWTVRLDDGRVLDGKYLITAVGQLSEPAKLPIPGLDDFGGRVLSTSSWPHEGVDFGGERVAVIGTGSSGVQVIPVIAREADHLTVFHRTPNFVIPLQNWPLDDATRAALRADHAKIWELTRTQLLAHGMDLTGRTYDDVTEEERAAIFEEGWAKGSFHFIFETFDDILFDLRSNEAAAEFIRRKIAETVHDPAVAQRLSPKGYPLIAKRPVMGTQYYETYNRDNVDLVDVAADPITAFTPTGLTTATAAYEFDTLVLATGFDVVTGAYDQIAITGERGRTLKDAWADGPQTVFGMSTPGFPNLLMITGPLSPIGNAPPMIEEHVEYIGQVISAVESRGLSRVEADTDTARAWTEACYAIVDASPILRDGPSIGSWYFGTKVPGKQQKPLYFFGGMHEFHQSLRKSAANGFDGLTFA